MGYDAPMRRGVAAVALLLTACGRGREDAPRPSASAPPFASAVASQASVASPGSVASAASVASIASVAPADHAPCPADMVLLAGGSFTMQKRPGRRSVAGFCIDRTEVRVSDYAACVRAKQCAPDCLEKKTCSAVPRQTGWGDREEDARASTFCNGQREGRGEHPVNCVSFQEAQQYCAARGRRLPTEVEWEWAARGGAAGRAFPWGARAPTGPELCWGRPHRRDGTCAVGTTTLDRTPDGVLDMGGNVSEWTASSTVAGAPGLLFGASWYAVDDGYVRGALGGIDSPATRSELFGFRCAGDAR